MKLLFKHDIFIAAGNYAERFLPKSSGFLWHPVAEKCTSKAYKPGGVCMLCTKGLFNIWWTSRKEAAAHLSAFADDSAKAALGEHLKVVAASKAMDVDAEFPVPQGKAYRNFQRAGIAYSLNRSGTLIGDEMGLGKTIQAIGVLNARTDLNRVLIVAPKTLKINWFRELQDWLVRPFKVCVVDGVVPTNFVGEGDSDCVKCKGTGYDPKITIAQATCLACRPTPDVQHPRIIVIHYEQLTRGQKAKSSFDKLMGTKWDLLIADEVHFLKNDRTIRSKVVLGKEPRKPDELRTPGLADVSAKKIYLTGTPILNKPIEAWPILHSLDPLTWNNFFDYAKRFCNAQKLWTGSKYVWDFTGSSHLSEFQEKARGSVLIRRLKVDVLTELPPKQRQIVCLPSDDPEVQALLIQEADVYSKHEQQHAQLLAAVETAQKSEDQTVYAQAVAALHAGEGVLFEQIAHLRHALALAKVPQVIEHLDDMRDEGIDKIIVFARHLDVIHKLEEKYGNQAVSVYGKIDSAQRQIAVDRFQTDPSVHFFIGGMHVAGVGLTLTAATNVVFAELDWVPANLSQCEDRAHRIGQKNSVLVQHLVFDKSLDARMAKILLVKQAISDKALDINPTTSVIGFKAALKAHTEAQAH